MWEKYERTSGIGGRASTRRSLLFEPRGRLAISSTLMDELGLPEAVDIYVDRREQRIGIVTGTSHKTYRADSSSTSSRRAVSLAGTLSDMRIPTEAVAKRPKFEVVMMDGRPMLVIWPLAPAEET